MISVYGQHKTAPADLVRAKLNAAITALGKLNTFLYAKKKGTAGSFLIDDKVTLADIAVVSGLVRGYQGVFDNKCRRSTPRCLSTPRGFWRSRR